MLQLNKKSFQINDERVLTQAECGCIAGLKGVCKHIAAVAHYINTEEGASKTSASQTWGKPSDFKKKYAKGKLITELMDLKPPQKRKRKEINNNEKDCKSKEKKRKINNNEKDRKTKTVQSKSKGQQEIPSILSVNLPKNCPLNEILMFEKKTEVEKVVSQVMKDILGKVSESVNRQLLTECIDIVVKNQVEKNIYTFASNRAMTQDSLFLYYSIIGLPLTSEKVLEICLATVAQHQNKDWFQIKKLKISASKAHPIVTRKAGITEKFCYRF